MASTTGYDKRFIHPLLKRHECPICLHAMRDPVQTECGHLFCRGCLDPVLCRDVPLCPLDNAPISKEDVFPDNACRREILALEVRCDFEASGCSWIGPLKELQAHCSGCEHQVTKCRQCGLDVVLQSLATHQEKECPMRTAACQYCGRDVPVEQIEAHITSVCVEYVHPCPNRCDPSLRMKLPQLEAHLDPRSGDCPLAEVPCPFKPYGCTFVSPRQDISTHMDQAKLSHASLQANSWTQLSDQVASASANVERIGSSVSALEAGLHSVQGLQNAMEERLEAMDLRVREGQTHAPFSTQVQIEMLQAQIVELKRKVEGEMAPMGGYSFEPAPKAMGGGDVGHRVDTLHTKVAELDHGLDRCLSSCLDQELRLQLLERATYNGILVWKIDDFERRRKEAVDGVTMSLYSIPFYTSRHGYKMCARVYLNGDGMGKGTHLSLFFVVMKGPFDALLSWPFKQKVTMTIINQAGKKHVTDTFRPDPQSNSFQRPTLKEMNVASGCPMFIRLEHLLNGGFVKDDCIFLRVVVDIADIVPLQ